VACVSEWVGGWRVCLSMRVSVVASLVTSVPAPTLTSESIAKPTPESLAASRFPFAVVTHASTDRLGTLERLAAAWRGPLSIAVFLPCCTDPTILVRCLLICVGVWVWVRACVCVCVYECVRVRV
jgi:hypothetical protein